MEGQADERGKISSFETIDLEQLAIKCNIACDNKEYVFIADMSGQANTFFEYQQVWMLMEAHGLFKSCSIAKKMTAEEVSDKIRSRIVLEAKYGRQLVLNLDTMVPQIKSQYDNATLPLTELILDRPKYDANFKKILTAGEDTDVHENPGLYVLNDKFNLIFLTNMSDPDFDDEMVQMVMDEIPHIDKFKKFYINPVK